MLQRFNSRLELGTGWQMRFNMGKCAEPHTVKISPRINFLPVEYPLKGQLWKKWLYVLKHL